MMIDVMGKEDGDAGKINSILVLGLGKVGSLVAYMLHETGFKVTGADTQLREDFPSPLSHWISAIMMRWFLF